MIEDRLTNYPQGRFYDACNYTPLLSALVKLTQLLTIQYSVWEEECGRVSYASDALQTVRSACLLRNSSTPFGWILTLRSYGRRIRNNTTSAGFISWTDDFSQLSFKDLTLDITAIRNFIQLEIGLLQQDLVEICLGPDKAVPSFDLHQLKDNPASIKIGWSFIQEPQNNLLDWKEWLLQRVLDCPLLSQRFFRPKNRGGELPKPPEWNCTEVRSYLKTERRFLTRLSLLIYLLSGQPARGTELFSLRFQNTSLGGSRSIFIEHGLVSFVTSYHKGYSIDGRLKLIHRYLTSDLSQILVQYLVLVRPFVQQLHSLAFNEVFGSSFLWAKRDTPWDTCYLTDFFAVETARELGKDSTLMVSSWRHIAIAISREFLPRGEYFDRAADQETLTAIDRQAGHHGLTAATIYGRLIAEGYGQVRQFRERYRRISLLWHQFWLQGSTEKSVPAESIDLVEQTAPTILMGTQATIQTTEPAEAVVLTTRREGQKNEEQQVVMTLSPSISASLAFQATPLPAIQLEQQLLQRPDQESIQQKRLSSSQPIDHRSTIGTTPRIAQKSTPLPTMQSPSHLISQPSTLVTLPAVPLPDPQPQVPLIRDTQPLVLQQQQLLQQYMQQQTQQLMDLIQSPQSMQATTAGLSKQSFAPSSVEAERYTDRDIRNTKRPRIE